MKCIYASRTKNNGISSQFNFICFIPSRITLLFKWFLYTNVLIISYKRAGNGGNYWASQCAGGRGNTAYTLEAGWCLILISGVPRFNTNVIKFYLSRSASSTVLLCLFFKVAYCCIEFDNKFYEISQNLKPKMVWFLKMKFLIILKLNFYGGPYVKNK